uniref:Calcium/calmodulin dependent protein kinase II inhibitor 1 n=1 Tax=Apteryx owenii TaxID=8824 RepID=A0A8B9Q0Q7_APTOW
MSQVLPYGEEKLGGFAEGAAVGQLPFACRLHDANGFFGGAQGKRPPKLGQIGRSKRGEISGIFRGVGPPGTGHLRGHRAPSRAPDTGQLPGDRTAGTGYLPGHRVFSAV